MQGIGTNSTVDDTDVRRLKGQNATILKLLQERPRTNVELSEFSLKYTSRISDIRNWLKENGGGTVVCKRARTKTNKNYTFYTLTGIRRETPDYKFS